MTPSAKFLYILQSSAIHVELHSFPTRRSSDLMVKATRKAPCRLLAPGQNRKSGITQHTPWASSEADIMPIQSSCSSGLRSLDRKSTRLNSSHEWISYAVFCLKKKKDSSINIRS